MQDKKNDTLRCTIYTNTYPSALYFSRQQLYVIIHAHFLIAVFIRPTAGEFIMIKTPPTAFWIICLPSASSIWTPLPSGVTPPAAFTLLTCHIHFYLQGEKQTGKKQKKNSREQYIFNRPLFVYFFATKSKNRTSVHLSTAARWHQCNVYCGLSAVPPTTRNHMALLRP